MNYFDILLAKKLNGGGGDITVESLSVTQNGTYTAPSGKAYSPVTVEVEPPENSYQLKSITTPTSLATFNASAMPMPSLKVSVEAKQDLHGYDHPWVGGAGKNKLENTLNTITYNGVTFTVNNDGSMLLSGTASGVAQRPINNTLALKAGQYILSGMAAGGSASTRMLYISDSNGIIARDTGNGATFTLAEDTTISVLCWINDEQTVNNVAIYPMIRLATETDPTFAPYSNICPISGLDEANINVTGVNIWDEEWEVGGINSTTGLPDSATTTIRSINYQPVLPSTTYYMNTASLNIWFYEYDSDKNYIQRTLRNNAEITTSPETKFFKIMPGSAYGTTYNNDISINYPSTDHDYHAYNGVTTTISLPQTVYGGEVDVVNGTSGNKVTHQLETISGGVSRTDSSGYLFVVKDLNVPDITDYETVTPYIISNYLTPYSVNDLRANAVFGFTQYNKRLYIRLGADITTVADANAFLASNPLQIKYELATPTTLTTQPTPIKSLNGTNNLSVDCGDVIEGEYFLALGGA